MRTWYFSNFYFFYFTTIGVFIPYWGLYLQHRGFNATEIGQLIAILTITKVITPNLWAALADNIAAKKGSSLGILKYAAFATLAIYCLLYVVDGANLPQLEAATLNHLQDKRDQYGLVRLWGSISFILVVLGLGWLMDYSGPGIILSAGALAFTSVLLASLLMRDVGVVRQPESVNERQPISQLVNGKVVFLLLLCVFMQISHAPWQAFFSIYLENYGYSKLSIGLLWSVGVVFEIVVFIVGYKLLRRFSLSSLLSFTFLVAGVRWCMVAAFPESMVLILITQIMHAVTYGLYHSVMIQLIDRFFQGRYQIRGQALYSSVTFGVGGGLGAFASGYLWTYYGDNALFMMAGVMMLLVFIVSALFVRRAMPALVRS